jgi:hypothetical protein
VKTQPSVVIGAPLAIFSEVWDLMPATWARQSGSRKLPVRPRRTTQRIVVIGARPVHLLPQIGLLISTACTFSTMCVFACFCAFRLSVVIGVRPAPTLDQYGLLASTACTFLRRLMLQTHTEPRRIIQRTVVIGARPSPKWASKYTTLAVVAALKTKIESKRPQTL